VTNGGQTTVRTQRGTNGHDGDARRATSAPTRPGWVQPPGSRPALGAPVAAPVTPSSDDEPARRSRRPSRRHLGVVLMSCLDTEDWKRVSRDPDLADDLGYDLLELDVLQSGGSRKYMILPHEEELVRDEVFIVAEEPAVQDVIDWV
jgi:hypothetical protein